LCKLVTFYVIYHDMLLKKSSKSAEIMIDIYRLVAYSRGMHTIVEMEEYNKKSKELLDEDERENLKKYLAIMPTAGKIMPGTGGVRKIRWKIQGKGKRGGVRIIYYYHSELMPLFLITIFGKNEKSNLTKAERNDLEKFIPILIKNYEEHH